MKKTFLLTCLLVTAITALAQKNDYTLKNKWLVTGSVSVFNNERDSNNATHDSKRSIKGFRILPRAAYKIFKNTYTGIGLGYEFSKSKYDETSINPASPEFPFSNRAGKENTFIVSPFIRSYKPFNKLFSGFLQLQYNYSSTKYNYENSYNRPILNSNRQTENTSEAHTIAIKPGISIFLTPKIALETEIGSIGYNFVNSEEKNSLTEGNSNDFSLSLNLTDIAFSVSFFF